MAIYDCSTTSLFFHNFVGLMMTQDEPKQGYYFYNKYSVLTLNYYHMIKSNNARHIFLQDGKLLPAPGIGPRFLEPPAVNLDIIPRTLSRLHIQSKTLIKGRFSCPVHMLRIVLP